MSRISDLHPAFQTLATKIVAWANANLKPARVVVSDSWRTPSQQANDHASGSSGVNLGWHNYGFAFDFLIYEADGTLVEDGNDPRYAQVGAYAASLGCKYPIHLPSGEVDHDHIEWHPAPLDQSAIPFYTLVELQAWYASHPVPTP